MNRHLSILACGALAAVCSPSGASPALVVNDSERPRFTAAGRLVQPGETFDPNELNTEEFLAKTTPIGNLSLEQLQAEIARRSGPANPGAPENEPAAAPVAPGVSQETLDRMDEERAQAAADAADLPLASDVIDDDTNPPDRDGDGKPGGSLTKVEIEAELSKLGVEYDKSAKRDDLGRQLDAELAKK